MNGARLQTLIEIAVMSAMAYVLDFVKFSGFWPQGGSVSLVMIPLAVLSFRRGVAAGMLAGLIVGILNLLFGGYVVHPVQLILAYPLPFAFLGVAGLFRRGKDTSPSLSAVVAGVVLAGGLRFLCHFISGVVWFGEYAPEGMNVWIYSLVYNLSYIVPEILITVCIMGIFRKRFMSLLKT